MYNIEVYFDMYFVYYMILDVDVFWFLLVCLLMDYLEIWMVLVVYIFKNF